MSDIALEAIGTHPDSIADIVFVHGLGGDARLTWRVRDDNTYWPKWLEEDLLGANIPCSVWALDYPAAATRWTSQGNSMALPDRATGVLEYMVNRGIGARPIVFIAHSLGGLLVKYVLRMSHDSAEAGHREVAERTLGVVFMATPHRGANLASLGNALQHVFRPTAETRDLAADSPYLNQIDMWYRDNVDQLRIHTFAVRENRKCGTKLWGPLPGPSAWVVDPTSADPNIPGSPVIPIDADHFEICKPTGRESPVYTNVKAFLAKVLADEQAAPRSTHQDRVRFLAGISKDEQSCLCVLSSFAGSVTQYTTTSGERREFRGDTVSPQDTSAAVYLCSLVSQARSFAKLAVRPAGEVGDEGRENHLLLVGSSLTNRHTRWALSLDKARYRFTLPDSGKFGIECRAVRGSDSQKRWLPNDDDSTLDREYEAGKATHVDYAIVERLKWKTNDIFVLAGLGPVGTQGAAYFLNENWHRLYRTYRDRPFGLVLRFGTKTQPGAFNDPTVVHRTDPADPEQFTEAPLG